MSIKKITLSLVGMLGAITFATDASAVPAFARQVGMACSACHQQHFPAINAFGRAFKEGGYTLIGAQEKIEGEDISLPSGLNAAIVGYMSYGKTNGPATSTPTGKTSNDGQLQIPQQVSLFFGGRGGEHVGFEAEMNIANAGTGTGQAGLIRVKVPFVFDVGNVKTLVIPFSTGNGVADSFDVLDTGAVNVHAFNQNAMTTLSAQQYIGTATNAHGIALVGSTDDYYFNIAKWGASNGDGSSGAASSTYLRGVWLTSLIPGFDSAIGFQNWRGSSADSGSVGAPATASLTAAGNCPAGSTWETLGLVSGNGVCSTPGGTANGVFDTKAWAVDAQMLGEVRGMPLTIIASYARAPAQGSNTNPNLFNAPAFGPGNLDKKSFNVAAELGLIPNKATVQLGLRRASSGNDNGVISGGAANGSNASDNSVMVGATYAIALNARLEFTYVKASGDMYNAASAAAQGSSYTGDALTYFDLAFGF
jgi:hypothetical protein